MKRVAVSMLAVFAMVATSCSVEQDTKRAETKIKKKSEQTVQYVVTMTGVT